MGTHVSLHFCWLFHQYFECYTWAPWGPKVGGCRIPKVGGPLFFHVGGGCPAGSDRFTIVIVSWRPFHLFRGGNQATFTGVK